MNIGMETTLGRGYSMNEDFGVADFYSPPSSIVDELEELDDDLFYPGDEGQEGDEQQQPQQQQHQPFSSDAPLPSTLVDEMSSLNLNVFQPSAYKMASNESTPPPTPLIPGRLLNPLNPTTTPFRSARIHSNLSIPTQKYCESPLSNWSSATMPADPRSNDVAFPRLLNNIQKMTAATTNLLTPTSIDRYLAGHRRLSDSACKSSAVDVPPSMSSHRHASISNQTTELNNEISRLYSYMNPVDEMPSNVRASSTHPWMNPDERYAFPSQVRMNSNPFVPQLNYKATSPSMNDAPWIQQRGNPMFPNANASFNQSPTFHQQQQQQQQSQTMMSPLQSQNTWLLSEMSTMLRQNQQHQQQQQQQQQQQSPLVTFNSNITLSATAQQILASNAHNNNNRPLRSEKIDIEVIKHLIREAKWKRQCGMKKEVCVFCRNNGENELIFSSHSLKDSLGNVTCPILRAYQCPICGATGAQAHTIKYCQATGEDNNQHIPTPYEKMIRTQCMQTFCGLDDSMPATVPTFLDQIGSPSSLYMNGWSNSYL